jgi:hypothetical protein
MDNAYASNSALSAKPDLSPKMALVWKLCKEGKTPAQIQGLTGMSPKLVCYYKGKLRGLGLYINQLADRASKRFPRLADDAPGASHDTDSAGCRSSFEPDDDEQPDSDEIIPAHIERCACGLTLPCHHEPFSPWRKTQSMLEPDHMVDVPGVRNGKPWSSRTGKVPQPAKAPTQGPAVKETGPGLAD